MKLIINTKELDFKYRKQKVINKLVLKVPENSIYGFLGPNGAGKSTTIKLLLGLLKSPNSTISIFGKDLNSNKKEILNNIGNLIETPSIYKHLTAYENLKYLNYIYKKNKNRIQEVLEIIGLNEFANIKVKNFSTGMKQRLGIGTALFNDPKLLILDEPVNGLDPQGVYEFRKLLFELNEQGKTIFLSSHLLNEIEKLCSNVGIINNGKMLYQGKMQDLIVKTTKYVSIKTSDDDKTIKILQKNDISIISKKNNTIKLRLNNNSEFNKSISLIINNNIEIYDIEKETGDLENVFINLTSN